MYKLSVAAPSRLTTDRKKYKQLKYTIKSDHSDGRRKFAWGLLFLFLFLLLATAVWIILRFHAQITRQDQELQKREEQLSEAQNENALLEQRLEELENEMDQLVLGAVSEHGVKDYRAYLTFDDGPSENTLRVLDILNEYGIKGTFFMNGTESDLAKQVYTRTIEEGHALGNHTYSHEYRQIYQSWDAFYREIQQMEACVKKQTGYAMPKIVRFPGGSNSASGDAAVMREIKSNLERLGYRYFDWNVSGEDALHSQISASEIYQNVVRYVDGKNVAVILLHTTDKTDATVECLPDIIEYLRSEGYSFHTLEEEDAPTYVVFSNGSIGS